MLLQILQRCDSGVVHASRASHLFLVGTSHLFAYRCVYQGSDIFTFLLLLLQDQMRTKPIPWQRDGQYSSRKYHTEP